MKRLFLHVFFAGMVAAPLCAQQRDTTASDSSAFRRSVREEVQRVLKSLGVRTTADTASIADTTTGSIHVIIGSGISEPKPYYEWQDFNWFRYNRVDGLFLGLGTSEPRTIPLGHLNDTITSTTSLFEPNALRSQGGFGYSFGSHFWTVEGGLSFIHRFNDGLRDMPLAFEVGVEGHVRTDTRDAWLVDLGENTAAALIAHEDFQDYFKRKGWSAKGSFFIGHEQLAVEYRHDEFLPLDTRQYWSLFGGRKLFRENDETLEPLQFSGNVPSIVLTSYFNNIRTNRLYHGWSLLAQAEYGAGQYGFSRYLVDIRRFQPLARWTAINVRMRAGTVQGEAVDLPEWHGFRTPVQEYFQIGGISTLPAFDYKEFAGNRMLLLNAEWNFSGRALHELFWFPFDNITVMFLADAGLAYFVDDTTNVIRGWNQMSIPNLKSDIGFAIGSENGKIRVGWMWRTDRNEGAKFFIRLSRPF